MRTFDVIIIGSGPAGMTSALYTSRAGASTLLLSRGLFGGQMNNTAGIENYPGFKNILGSKLGKQMKNSTTRFGVTYTYGNVQSISLMGKWKIVSTDITTYKAKAVIIATGAKQRKLGIPGENTWAGKGVSYCAVCDGNFFKNKSVYVVGGGDSAFTEAMYLSHVVSYVTILVRKAMPQAEHTIIKQVEQRPNIKILYNTEVQAIHGNKTVNSATLYNNKTHLTQIHPISAVFIYIGMIPVTNMLKNLNSKYHILTAHGWLKCNTHLQTSIPGIFAVGDVKVNQIRQVATAVGDGATVGHWVYQYLQHT